MPTRRAVLATAASLAVAGCGDDAAGQETRPETTPDGGDSDSLDLTSPAFDDGASIPARYTADGANVSPPLAIAGVPDDAASLALVVDDPDAGDRPWVHWLLWNVPPDTTEIPDAVPAEETVEELGGAAQGTNDFGDVGYGGPAPPAGDDAHTYRFRLQVLGTTLDLTPGAEISDLESAMDGQVLGQTTLTGTYDR